MKSIANFLDQEGRLVRFPAKQKMQREALVYLAGKFAPEVIYSEKEVNGLLNQWHTFGDPAALRRALCDVRLLDRDPYGKAYRLAGTEQLSQMDGV